MLKLVNFQLEISQVIYRHGYLENVDMNENFKMYTCGQRQKY